MFEMFLGVKSSEDNAGFSPFNSCPAPCDTTLPAILPANEPKRPMRDKRDVGTALLERVGDSADLLGFSAIGSLSFIKDEGERLVCYWLNIT
ncbi:hypothetical protein MGSAQ_000407 [marine sediment metagenome]|jgi:hypothetical protein|uniref:Uncharacterized protein n=1 Tax=marine sediment metagenome TaxID=412755 RepID=A0A1B6NXC4_9ZZZZ